MQALIADRLEEIAELCRQHHVKRLALFGSAAREDFDPERSDVDLLVEFEDVSLEQRVDFFTVRSAFVDLFAREVDLVDHRVVKNPVLKRHIAEDGVLLYAA